MGSLDAQFMQHQSYNPLLFSQEFPPPEFQNPIGATSSTSTTSTSSYRPSHCDRDPALGFSQAYNPFAPAPSAPHPARYNPLSQSLPISPIIPERPATAAPPVPGFNFSSYNTNTDARGIHEFPPPANIYYESFERPTTVHGYTSYSEPPTARGYNPFCQEFEAPAPPVVVAPHDLVEGSSLVPYNYQLPIRACTPPAIRQYGPPHFPAQFPVVETPRDAVVPFDSTQNGKSQRLLWLSEEEAEIIRLIRLSQMKENLKSSGFSVSEEQEQLELSPDVSPNPGADLRASTQTIEKRSPGKCSNVSTMSADEFSLPAAVEPPRSKAAGAANGKKELPESRKQRESTEASPEKTTRLDQAKTVDDDREWISIQRQKIKDIQARKQNNAAVCIQRLWREHLKNKKTSRKKQASARVPAKVKDKRLSEAAAVIQRSWRAAIQRTKLKKKNRLPRTLKGLYESIKFRHSSKGLTPPSYVRFLKLLDRVHACTEGARVRKRLKTRRLQAIIKEIKEIRVLLEDMSTDGGPATSELLSQLSSQLQQKTAQLHTALQGPGDTARNLLRRNPATPLVVYGSKSSSSSSAASQRAGDQVQIRVIDNTHTENGVPAVRCSLFTVKKPPGAAKDSADEEKQAIKQGVNTQKPESRSLSHDEKPLKRLPEFKVKAPENNNPESRSVKSAGWETQRSVKNSQYLFIEKNLDLPSSRSDPAVASRLSQILVSSSSRFNKEDDAENTRRTLENLGSDSEQHLDQEKPKRPFLRRKSIAMAPQKLDWSKVKPMVSSRLEPELKTKLYKSKVKDFARSASLKKMNYNNVKSRLFSYESQGGVDASGALSSDRSLEFEALGRQGYAEIHTQVDYKEDCWSSADESPGDSHSQDLHHEPHRNYRYAEARPEPVTQNEEVELEEETPPAPKPPPAKPPPQRFERNRKSYVAAARAQARSSLGIGENERIHREEFAPQAQAQSQAPAFAPASASATSSVVDENERNRRGFAPAQAAPGSALEEIDHNGELERKKQGQHSFRYKETPATASETSVCMGDPLVKDAATRRDRTVERRRLGELCSDGGKVEEHLQREIVEASPELEATFKHVMAIKTECTISVSNMFGAPQQAAKSIIPRLLPDASIFNSSFSEKRRLHELLIQEGRASKLQHDSLAFVSIRD